MTYSTTRNKSKFWRIKTTKFKFLVLKKKKPLALVTFSRLLSMDTA